MTSSLPNTNTTASAVHRTCRRCPRRILAHPTGLCRTCRIHHAETLLRRRNRPGATRHEWLLAETRTKLDNLVDDLDDRLTAGEHRGLLILVDTLLHRLTQLAESLTGDLLCVRCPNPATHVVKAGEPGTDSYRSEVVCRACLRPSTRWVANTGPVRTEALDPCPQEVVA